MTDDLPSKKAYKVFRINLAICSKYICYSDPRSGIPLPALKFYGIITNIFIISESSLKFRMLELQMIPLVKLRIRSDTSITWFVAQKNWNPPTAFFLYSEYAATVTSFRDCK